MEANRSRLIYPSILDRLLDDAPDNPRAEPVVAFDLTGFKRALARDLEALLNTRVMDQDDVFAPFPMARRSMLHFGIPDLSGISLLNPDHRELLRTRLQQAIENYEPRLSRIKVNLDAPRELERHLRFRVDAVLRVHPHRPPITFDATLQLSSNVYRIPA